VITNIGCELTTMTWSNLQFRAQVSGVHCRSQVVAACVWVDYLILKFN
jgi:hypothetical protein